METLHHGFPLRGNNPFEGYRVRSPPVCGGWGVQPHPTYGLTGKGSFCLTAVSSPNPSFMRGFDVGYERVPHPPRQGVGRPPLTPRRGRFPFAFLFQKRMPFPSVFPLEIRLLRAGQGAKSPLLGAKCRFPKVLLSPKGCCLHGFPLRGYSPFEGYRGLEPPVCGVWGVQSHPTYGLS